MNIHGAASPPMAVVASNDSRYSEIPRIQSPLVDMRKRVGVYKGRLCARCESMHLTRTSFTSIPAVHRCGVKLACAVSAIFFSINSVAVSQAFPQSDNLAETDRCNIIPPLMIQFPWAGKLHSPETNLRTLPKPSRGF